VAFLLDQNGITGRSAPLSALAVEFLHRADVWNEAAIDHHDFGVGQPGRREPGTDT
jgi:hypothetical protein